MRCAGCRLELGDGTLPVDWSEVDVASEVPEARYEHDGQHWSGRPKEYLHAHDDVSASPSDGPDGPLRRVGATPARRHPCVYTVGVTSNSALRSQDRD